MTSQQLQRKLAQAVAIVTDCERFLEDPYAESRAWDAVDLKHRVRDFIDTHREDERDGGQP